MASNPALFQSSIPLKRKASLADGVVLISLAVLIYAGLSLATRQPPGAAEGEITLAPSALPVYTLFSLRRMLLAYLLSMLFTLVYGRIAASQKAAERIMLPVLDILQSVPILSFLPVVLLSLSAILPQRLAAELASVVLIFTSQAWNLTYAWYQSLTTIPKDLSEAASMFRLNTWMRFKTLELPYAAISLIWNSMLSWAGGWFFLMAAEIFTVGQHQFHLPGLGAYLQEAAIQGDLAAVGRGLGILVLVIIILDQWVWRPLLAWADRFKIESVESDTPPTSWFFDLWHNARLVNLLDRKVVTPAIESIDHLLIHWFPGNDHFVDTKSSSRWLTAMIAVFGSSVLLYGALRVGQSLSSLPVISWLEIGSGLVATLLRVLVALGIALLWTVPAGVAIGSNPRLAAWLQPVVQIVASLPATALFPVLVAALIPYSEGLNLAAILLLLMGTQWYLLFNVIAGAAAIPQDLKYTASLLGLNRFARWRNLTLPALFPYLITGAITASGGAWNASIVAEYLQFNGKTVQVTGIGALIARATAGGDYPLLLAATLSMILAVVLINRYVWRRFYLLAEEQFRLE